MKTCDVSICKAACCGPVPFTKEFLKKHKKEITKGIKALGPLCVDLKTLRCGFLSEENKCRVYDERPEICKLFGDPSSFHPLLKCQFLGQITKEEQEKIAINISKGASLYGS